MTDAMQRIAEGRKAVMKKKYLALAEKAKEEGSVELEAKMRLAAKRCE